MKVDGKIKISNWRTTFANGESAAIARSISSEHISQGPVVAEFERQLAAYLQVPYAVATTSGSMALLMSMLVAGIGVGDEVIVPNRTWIATAHAPHLLGATVRLIDVEAERPIIAAELIEAAITERTRAIIPVHLCGRSADMRSINRIARKFNLTVVEDAAQALGSRNSDGYLGTQSDMGCFSLSVAKIIATGQGGFLVTKNEETYNKLVAIRTHGVADIVHATWDQPGFNFRFTDILATIGIEQMKQLPSRIGTVKKIYQLYCEGLADLIDIKIIPVNVESGEVPVYVEVICKKRDELLDFLSQRGIQCRPFYPNLNRASYLKSEGDYPQSIRFENNGLYLPAGPDQPVENIQSVIRAIKEFYK